MLVPRRAAPQVRAPLIVAAAIGAAARPSPLARNPPPPPSWTDVYRAAGMQAMPAPALRLCRPLQLSGLGNEATMTVIHRRPVNHHHKWVKTSTNRRLRGVAAKYLDDCLAWMRMREWFEDGTEPEHSTVSGLGQQTINR